MKKILQIFFLSLFITSGVYAADSDSGVVVTDKSNAGIAEAIANSDGNSTTKDLVKGFREIKEDIVKAKTDPKATTHSKLCKSREALLVSGSTVVKQMSPLVYLLMTILVLMSIKRFFIDNPEQQKNGLSSNVIGGSLYLFFAVILSNFKKLINWWDETLIPEFSALCNGGAKDALSVTILKHVLAFLFTLVQFIGVIIVIMGIVDMIKKDRSGTVNVYGIGSKIIGGVLLINYKWVLDFIGVIKL